MVRPCEARAQAGGSALLESNKKNRQMIKWRINPHE